MPFQPMMMIVDSGGQPLLGPSVYDHHRVAPARFYSGYGLGLSKIRVVPVFDSDSSSWERCPLCMLLLAVSFMREALFRFWFSKNGPDGSGCPFGS